MAQIVASTGRKGNPIPSSYLQQMPDYEEERKIIITKLEDIHDNIGDDFPYPIDNQPNSFTYTENIFGMEKLTPMPNPEETIGLSRTKVENDSTVSSGIAYQCNVNEKGEPPIGFHKTGNSIRKDIERLKKGQRGFEFESGWKVQPYKFKDDWQQRSDWRRMYSWMTGLPLWFDTRVKPQCEHKIPLFQQVYQIMGPISVTAMRASTSPSSKSFKKRWYGKLMSSLDKLVVELAVKINRNIKDKNDLRNNFKRALRNKIIRQIKNSDISVGFESDAGTVLTTSSVGRVVTNTNAQEPDFLINKYLIRQECYAWEYAYTNMWAKSQEMFIKLSISENNVLSFDINEDVIKQCVNTLSWCLLGTLTDRTKPLYTNYHYDLCDSWAEIALNIIKLTKPKRNDYKGVVEKIREHMGLKYGENDFDPIKNSPTTLFLEALDIMNWIKLYPDEGVLSLINACLGGKEIIDLELPDRRYKVNGTAVQYSRAFIYANMCNQMIFLKHLLNYGINEGPYKIGNGGDQGIRNMLRLNYLRLKRMVKKNPGSFDMDRFKAQPLFIALRDINSVDAVKKSDAEDYFKNQSFVAIQAGGGHALDVSRKDPFEQDTGGFLNTFFEWTFGHEGGPKGEEEDFEGEDIINSENKLDMIKDIIPDIEIDIPKDAEEQDIKEIQSVKKAFNDLTQQGLENLEDQDEEGQEPRDPHEYDYTNEIEGEITAEGLAGETVDMMNAETPQSPTSNPYTDLTDQVWSDLGQQFRDYLANNFKEGETTTSSQEETMDVVEEITPLSTLRDDLFTRVPRNGAIGYVNNASDRKLYRILARQNRMAGKENYGSDKNRPREAKLPGHVIQRSQWAQLRRFFSLRVPIEDRLIEFGMTNEEPGLINELSGYIQKEFGKKVPDRDIIRYILDPPASNPQWNTKQNVISLSRNFRYFLEEKNNKYIIDAVEDGNKAKGTPPRIKSLRTPPSGFGTITSEPSPKYNKKGDPRLSVIKEHTKNKRKRDGARTKRSLIPENFKKTKKTKEEDMEVELPTCHVVGCELDADPNQGGFCGIDHFPPPGHSGNEQGQLIGVDGRIYGGKKKKRKKRTKRRKRKKKKTRKSKRKKKRTKKKRRRRKKRTRRRR